METLLTKVQAIESEANAIIEGTRQKKTEALQHLQSQEAEMLADTRSKALERGKSIIAEQLRIADKEANTIKQQGENSEKMVHSAAEKNRSHAVKLAEKFFQEEYLA